jgi:uncharacterized protein YggE
VAQRDLRTSQVSLAPRYTEDGSAINGYVAQNSVLATIRSLGRAGAVIDAAVNAGANQVFGPTLVASDRAQRYRTALRAALGDARSKAEALADEAGVSLGRVLSVREEGTGPVPVEKAEATAVRQADVPIEPGTESVEATVSVSFAIS